MEGSGGTVGKAVAVAIFGFGGVGRALLRLIVSTRLTIASRVGRRIAVVAVCNSTALHAKEGFSELSDEAVEQMAAGKGDCCRLPTRPSNEDVVRMVARHHKSFVIVDVTASDGMDAALTTALDLGGCVVLANKRPMAGKWATASRYFGCERVRHESTVGGGDPYIATLRRTLDTGDRITRIVGQLSGSLAFVFSRLQRGVAFSSVVREAMANGFTEPDPRDDLSGGDVGRKLLILARVCGMRIESSDVEIETLVNGEVEKSAVGSLLSTISDTMDVAIEERRAAAESRGCVLRYLGEVDVLSGRVSASLREVPISDAMDTGFIRIFTDVSWGANASPLLVSGAGAGCNMTASGVIGDIVGLVREHLL